MNEKRKADLDSACQEEAIIKSLAYFIAAKMKTPNYAHTYVTVLVDKMH